MAEKKEKIAYLDGMRGLAALNVFFTHILAAFYPAVYTGRAELSHVRGGWDALLGHSLPAGILAGNLAVPLLFLLSAYVLSFRFFMYRDAAIATANAYRRYLRLELPVLVSMVLGWGLLRMGAFSHLEAAGLAHSEWFLGSYYAFAPDFLEMLPQAFWQCFSPDGGQSYNPVLWTMNFELLGSFTVFAFLALFGRSRGRWLVYLFLGLVFLRSYYFAFVLGLLLSDLRYSDWGARYREFLRGHSTLGAAAIVLGVFLGNYFPQGQTVIGGWLELPVLRLLGVDFFAFWHIAGAAFVFLGILYHEPLQHLLSLRPLRFFGRIAFSIYLLHFMLLCSAGCFVFLRLSALGWSYSAVVAAVVLVLVPVVLAASYALTRLVDEPGARLVKRIQQRYFY